MSASTLLPGSPQSLRYLCVLQAASHYWHAQKFQKSYSGVRADGRYRTGRWFSPQRTDNRRKQGVKWCLQESSMFLAEVRFQSFWRQVLTFQKQGRRDGRAAWPHKAPKVAKAACAGRAERGEVCRGQYSRRRPVRLGASR